GGRGGAARWRGGEGGGWCVAGGRRVGAGCTTAVTVGTVAVGRGPRTVRGAWAARTAQSRRHRGALTRPLGATARGPLSEPAATLTTTGTDPGPRPTGEARDDDVRSSSPAGWRARGHEPARADLRGGRTGRRAAPLRPGCPRHRGHRAG